jgi:hypothetical protein
VGEHDDQVDALAYAVLEVQNKKSFKAFWEQVGRS